jgi:hypothetical protein
MTDHDLTFARLASVHLSPVYSALAEFDRYVDSMVLRHSTLHSGEVGPKPFEVRLEAARTERDEISNALEQARGSRTRRPRGPSKS